MSRSTSSACVLVSGGLDSAVLLGTALSRYETVHPLYLRCGLAWEAAELHWLRRFLRALPRGRLKPLTVLDVPAADVYGSHWSLTARNVPGASSRDEAVYLPGRNLLLLSKAAVFCALRGVPVLFLGTLRGNPFPDSTPRFFRTLERAVRLGLKHRISLRAPFSGMSKAQVLKKGRALPLHLTFSCLAPRGRRPCGRCNKCAERARVLPGRPAGR